MSRQRRREVGRKVAAFYERIKKHPDDIEVMEFLIRQTEKESQDRLLALVFAALNREFGFAEKRIERLTQAIIKVSE